MALLVRLRDVARGRGRLRGAATRSCAPTVNRRGEPVRGAHKQSGENTVAVTEAVRGGAPRGAAQDLPGRHPGRSHHRPGRASSGRTSTRSRWRIVFGGGHGHHSSSSSSSWTCAATLISRRGPADLERHRHVLSHVRARLHAQHDDAPRVCRSPSACLIDDASGGAREHLQAPRAAVKPPAQAATRRHPARSRSAVLATTAHASCAVFLPVAFVSACMVGQFFRQFGITVSGATVMLSRRRGLHARSRCCRRVSRCRRSAAKTSPEAFAWHQAADVHRLFGLDGQRPLLRQLPRHGPSRAQAGASVWRACSRFGSLFFMELRAGGAHRQRVLERRGSRPVCTSMSSCPRGCALHRTTAQPIARQAEHAAPRRRAAVREAGVRASVGPDAARPTGRRWRVVAPPKNERAEHPRGPSRTAARAAVLAVMPDAKVSVDLGARALSKAAATEAPIHDRRASATTYDRHRRSLSDTGRGESLRGDARGARTSQVKYQPGAVPKLAR